MNVCFKADQDCSAVWRMFCCNNTVCISVWMPSLLPSLICTSATLILICDSLVVKPITSEKLLTNSHAELLSRQSLPPCTIGPVMGLPKKLRPRKRDWLKSLLYQPFSQLSQQMFCLLVTKWTSLPISQRYALRMQHLNSPGTSDRMLFADFSTTFNTIDTN